jgi:hypothetical protein
MHNTDRIQEYKNKVVLINPIQQHHGPILPIKNDRTNPEPREITDAERKKSAWKTLRGEKKKVRAVGYHKRMENRYELEKQWSQSMAGKPQGEKWIAMAWRDDTLKNKTA